MYIYEHTQPGKFIRAMTGLWVMIFGVGSVVMVVLGGKEHAFMLSACIVMLAVFTAIIFVLFHSLTVRISRNDMVIAFGVGLIQKNFAIGDIRSVRIVRNRWYHGWGIRKIRGGWLYNVSGYDAVEIQLKNERKYRIGTDQPEKLLAAVESALAGLLR
ncbi:MAG: hypothetical protein VCA55_02615 [Verrucomicrobiales bacterium]